MSDLTKIINQDYITEDIDRHYESVNIERTHLGLSQCGKECQRELWYIHNGYPKEQIKGRILRLFQLGNILEDQIRQDFMGAGYGMHSDQKEISFKYNGLKLVGHCDGIVTGLHESNKPHLWECKTAGDKAFKKLLKLRSYQGWNATYYGQIQIYMMGLKLDRSLVTVYNKNDSNVYQERISLDKDYAIKLLETVFKTISLDKPPPRKCPRANWFETNFCDYKKTCWRL